MITRMHDAYFEKICIYCGTKDAFIFTGVEHVIPQSFGKFGTDTPTLTDSVCDQCNAFFAKELDQPLARDTWEGITRYKKGRRSREKRALKRIRLSLDTGEETGIFAGALLGGVDGTTGQLIPLKPQFQILNKRSGKYEVCFLEEIKNFKMDDSVYGTEGTRNIKLFADSAETHEALIGELAKLGLKYNLKEYHVTPPFAKDRNDNEVVEIPVSIEGEIDHTIKRAYVKILLNFSAHQIGIQEVMKPEWKKAFNYVRYNLEPLLGKMHTEPFWGDETQTLRWMDDSINVLVENKPLGVTGKIQFYNQHTFEFILVENYTLPPEKEAGMRFTDGKPPIRAEKRSPL